MLDEPFNGMDPEGIIWMREFLRSLAAQGRAVLVSSHLMSELQDCADHLVVAGRGRVIADASVTQLLKAASGGRATLRTAESTAAAAALANAGATITRAGAGTLTVAGLTTEAVVAVLNAARVPFSEVAAHRATLEDAYLDLTRDAVDFRAAAGAEAVR